MLYYTEKKKFITVIHINEQARISNVCGNVTENPNAMYNQQLMIRYIFKAVDGKHRRSKKRESRILCPISKKDNEKDDPLPARFRRKSDVKGR